MVTNNDKNCIVELFMCGKSLADVSMLTGKSYSGVLQVMKTLEKEKKDEYLRKGFLRGDKFSKMAEPLRISVPAVSVRIKRNLNLGENDRFTRRHNLDLMLGRIKAPRYCKNCGDDISTYKSDAIYCRTCSNKCRQSEYYNRHRERCKEKQREYYKRKNASKLHEKDEKDHGCTDISGQNI